MDRITVDELRNLIQQGAAPLILDARPKEHQDRDGMIPGALAYVGQDVEAFALSSGEVIVYCNCPNEASAAIIAKQLMKLGAKRVRPLLGGMDAWVASQDSLAPLASPP
jgi:rhodanese-related sulfurtransferase